MAHEVRKGSNAEAPSVKEAYGAARDLLSLAEAEAARVRADADRYVRQRESEAELLVAKARRLLEAAEAQAAAIRVVAHDGPTAGRPAPPEADVVIDLDAMAAEAVTEAAPATPDRVSPARRDLHARVVPPPVASADGFDGILATAITRAVDRALEPSD